MKDGVENITIRPLEKEGVETGLRLTLVDFSMSGFRFEASPEFIRYVVPRAARPKNNWKHSTSRS